MAGLRNHQPVAGEFERRAQRLGRSATQAHHGVVAETDRHGAAVVQQPQPALFLHQAAGDELDGLVVSALTFRPEPRAAKLLGDVFRRKPVSAAAGVPSLEPVIREIRDMGPPVTLSFARPACAGQTRHREQRCGGFHFLPFACL